MINLPLLYCLEQATCLHLHYIFPREAHGSATSLCFCNCRFSKQRHHTSLCQQVDGDKIEMWSLFLKLSCFKCSHLSSSSTSRTQTGHDALCKHFPFLVSHRRILQPIPSLPLFLPLGQCPHSELPVDFLLRKDKWAVQKGPNPGNTLPQIPASKKKQKQ